VIDRRELVRALDRRDIADWVLVERAQEIAVADEPTHTQRAERRTRWVVTVHVDVFNGRGSARLEIDAVEGNARALVEQAIALAQAAVGPAWTSAPPAAPAKVALLDVTLAEGDPLIACDAMLRTLRRPKDAEVHARATALREKVSTQARAGLRREWLASMVRVDALVIAHGRSLEVTRQARRVMDLDIDAALAGAASDLGATASAKPAEPGASALVLASDALLHDVNGTGLGVWTAFAQQADALVERQGLTRYREGAPLVPGADQIAEPLTIASDGAHDYGLRSAPLGDDGDAVRRFTLVERGIAAGLGLSPREAALRKRDPNGGVRNLVISTGSWDGRAPTGRVLEVRRLRSLAIDPYTGEATLEVALAIDPATTHAFTGGTIRLDLIDALAKAHRSSGKIRRGAYIGPPSVLIETATLL
jgi:predicted Zn-dependent protease